LTIRLPYSLFPYQKKYYDRLKGGGRFSGLAGGRRSGKSVFAHHWLLRGGLEDEEDGLNVWCAPTIKQAIKVGYREFLNTTRKWPRQLIDSKESQGLLKICGKEFFFTSSDNADAMRGLKIKRIVLDEAAYQKESTWIEVIRPALADMQGSALLASTYNGFNWFYDIMNDPKWMTDKWPTAMNPLIKAEEIESMREQMDEQTFNQEIMAIATTALGLVFERVFAKENILTGALNIPKGAGVGVSIDFGYNDPCAVGFFRHWIAEDGWPVSVLFDELRCRFELIEHVLVKIIAKLKEYGFDAMGLPLSCDIAGLQTTGVSGTSYIEKIVSKRIFHVMYAACGIEERLNLVRGFFLSASNRRRFFIHERCIETLREVRSYEIKGGEDPRSYHDHFPDMIGYYFVNQITPMIPRKIIIENERGYDKKAQLKKCLRCGRTIITFKGEGYCKECEKTLMLEV
jgi:hypothetical protein